MDEQKVSDLFEQIPKPRIILGDFNAHNELWGSDTTNIGGRSLENVIDTSNLILLNSVTKTRFNAFSGKHSVLDLTLCDPALAPLLSWKVLPDLYDSDHFPILIEHNKISNEPSTVPQRWKLNNANWTLFSHLVDYNIPYEIKDEAPINEIVKNFTHTIIEAATQAIGKTSPVIGHRPVPWWNKECEEANKLTKHAFNRLKKQNTLENILEFKKLRAQSRYIFKYGIK
ncbi:uncharacterized protein [Leptinotarsa decemlineata]|uniref:uncharacterized protein n=1 Tax=Leptinotarsa decemlineata TaxID=7539 RepID=UPI003D304633